MEKTLKERKLEKRFLKAAAAYLFPYHDFEIVYTEIARKYVNPSDCKKVLAKFNHNGKHWVIYLKK